MVHRLGYCRQEDSEGRSLSQSRLATDDTAALLDNSENGREAQAGSFASLFRREERLEDVGVHFRVHANAGVAYGQRHVAPRRRRRSAGIGFSQGEVGRLNG